MKKVRLVKRLANWAGCALALLAALVVLAGAAWVWTEQEWFASVGHVNVFWGSLASLTGVFALFALAGFAILYPSARAAWLVVSAKPRFPRATALVCALLASGLAIVMARQWTVFRLAVGNQSFGVKDLQFGLDIGFFVFVLPALERIYQWANGLIAIALIVVTAITASSRLQLDGTLPTRWPRLRRVLATLFGALMVAVSFNFFIQVWRLSYSGAGQIYGASYADIHASLPALWIMCAASFGLAIVLFVAARQDKWKPMLIGFLAWAVAGIVLVGIWPFVVENYVAAPNEATLETPYRARNIAMTRAAFDLTNVTGTPYPAMPSVAGSSSAGARTLLSDAAIWTPSTVTQAFTQLQTIRPYYRLSRVDYDRYEIDGELKQVLVAAREVDPTGLPSNARTWVNSHLVYTHGYGLAVSSASKTTEQGFPLFFVGDVPSSIATSVVGASTLQVSEPRIYFGPDMTGYAVTNTGVDEFDFPQGETNATTRYKGTGAPVGGVLTRLAWATRLGSYEFIFSGYVKPESQVLLYRNIRTRVNKIAPWLTLDANAYPAIVAGRIVWIIDGVTSTDHYPNSQPVSSGVNYLRDSVKVVVDAYSGDMKLYASGADPIRDAWAAMFPGVVTPESEMPAGLKAHIRASQTLVSTQAQAYQAYHMTDPTVFYNREDLWQVPTDASGTIAPPAYVMLDLAGQGSSTKGMYVLQPFTLPNRSNLVAWMAVGCDPGEYDARTVYLMPKARVILGQAQVSARINQDPRISQQLTLWNQPGVSVLFGNMLVLPVEDSVAYVQPIFLQAQKGAMSQLASVIVVNGDRVEFAPTLEGALAAAYPSEATTPTP